MPSKKHFQTTVLAFYREHKRILPWREKITPYGVVVSEIMLQQTQVSRILVKLPEFTRHFPDFQTLAKSSTRDVLTHWQGMGYNRRGLYLKAIAENIVTDHNGILPQDPAILEKLPGIGKATAGSIAAFAYNIPTIFIETNIRRVFLHHFFPGLENVSDKDILPLVEEMLDKKDPRTWYYALMDYGTHLGKQGTNPNRRSKHYTVQSRFEGSDRQIRSRIVKLLLKNKHMTENTIKQNVDCDEKRLNRIIHGLLRDTMITKKENIYQLPK